MNRLSAAISWAPLDRIGFASRHPQLKVHAPRGLACRNRSDFGRRHSRPSTICNVSGPAVSERDPLIWDIFQRNFSAWPERYLAGLQYLPRTLRLKYAPFDRAASQCASTRAVGEGDGQRLLEVVAEHADRRAVDGGSIRGRPWPARVRDSPNSA